MLIPARRGIDETGYGFPPSDAKKIANIADDIPLLKVTGPEQGDLLVVGWGGTYGSILSAVERGDVPSSRYDSYVKLREEAVQIWPRW